MSYSSPWFRLLLSRLSMLIFLDGLIEGWKSCIFIFSSWGQLTLRDFRDLGCLWTPEYEMLSSLGWNGLNGLLLVPVGCWQVVQFDVKYPSTLSSRLPDLEAAILASKFDWQIMWQCSRYDLLPKMFWDFFLSYARLAILPEPLIVLALRMLNLALFSLWTDAVSIIIDGLNYYNWEYFG